jgi:ribonuclease D
LAFWRDTFARIEDESREFVLSDEYLGSLVIDPPVYLR